MPGRLDAMKQRFVKLSSIARVDNTIIRYRDVNSARPSYCYTSVCLQKIIEHRDHTMEPHHSLVQSLLRFPCR